MKNIGPAPLALSALCFLPCIVALQKEFSLTSKACCLQQSTNIAMFMCPSPQLLCFQLLGRGGKKRQASRGAFSKKGGRVCCVRRRAPVHFPQAKTGQPAPPTGKPRRRRRYRRGPRRELGRLPLSPRGSRRGAAGPGCRRCRCWSCRRPGRGARRAG